MKPPYARPGHMGLDCGQCGDAMSIIGRTERHRPETWHCTKCATSWRVPVTVLTGASRTTKVEA